MNVFIALKGSHFWFLFVVSKLSLRMQPARRQRVKKAPKRLNVCKLNQDSKRQAFTTDIDNNLSAVQLNSKDPEENWAVFRTVVCSLAVNTVGYASRKNQDWFDGKWWKIQLLLERKHRLHKVLQDDTSSFSKKASNNNICETVQRDAGTYKIPGLDGLTMPQACLMSGYQKRVLWRSSDVKALLRWLEETL